MDYSITYDKNRKFFYIATEGDFCATVFRSLADRLLTNPDWRPGASCLFDYRNTDFLKVSNEDLLSISKLHRKRNETVGKGKSALVMKCQNNYGMGRMYQGMTEFHVDTSFQVFTDLGEAEAWLASSEEPA